MEIKDYGPPLKNEDLSRLEGDLGVTLPGKYKEFLLNYNGGAPDPYLVDVPDLPGSPTDIQVFFGIGREVESSDLRWNFYKFGRDQVRGSILPIGCDSGGGIFALRSLSSEVMDICYFEPFDSTQKVFSVAEGFAEFLAKIRGFS